MASVLRQTFSLVDNEDLLKHVSIMFVATVIGGCCNYIFQLYMGRALGPVDYGIFGSLFAISYILSILTSTIQTGIARFISKFTGEKNSDKINRFIKEIMKRMFILGIILFLAMVLFSGLISSFLKIESNIPVVILGSVFIFSTILPVNLGALQGMQNFSALGLNNVLNYSSKLVFGIILIFIGWGVNGALVAIVMGSAIATVISTIAIKPFLYKTSSGNRDINLTELYKYSFPTMIAMFCFTVPANVDLIIAKHVFEFNTAGVYTAVTVLGKIILFIPGAIAIVMFPKISKLFAEKKNTIQLLLKSLILTGGLSGFMAIIYWLFPSAVIQIPYGSAYIGGTPVLQMYGLVMFFFSLIVVFMRYSLAVHFFGYVYILFFFTTLEIILLILFHSSMMEMVNILVIVNGLLLVSSCIFIALKWRFIRNVNGVQSND